MKNGLFKIFVILAVFTAASCSHVKHIPVETIREVHVRDSVYLRDTLIRIELEKARLSDFVDVGDTLVLQTDLARSTAYVDTTAGKLKGTIENIKPYVEEPIPVQHKIEYRDSVVYQDKPYPVYVEKIVKKVPWIYRVMSGIGIVALGLFAGWMIGKYLHLKP